MDNNIVAQKKRALAAMLNGEITQDSLTMIKEQAFLGGASEKDLKNPQKLKKEYDKINNRRDEDFDDEDEDYEEDITAKLQKRLNEAKQNGGNSVSIDGYENNSAPKDVSTDSITALLSGGVNKAREIESTKKALQVEQRQPKKKELTELDEYYSRETKSSNKPKTQNITEGLNMDLLNMYIEEKARSIAKEVVKQYFKEEMPKFIKIIANTLKNK